MYGQKEYTFLPLEEDTAETRESDALPKTIAGSKPFSGVTFRVKVANRTGTITFTPRLYWVTPTDETVLMWEAAAAIAADGTTSYYIHPFASAGIGEFTESAPGVVAPRTKLSLAVSGSGTADTLVDGFFVP